MSHYVILSKISPDTLKEPSDFRDLAERVSAEIKEQCPSLSWKDSYATYGRFDVIDIVETDDPKELQRALMLLRAHGHESTETLAATPWKEFLGNF